MSEETEQTQTVEENSEETNDDETENMTEQEQTEAEEEQTGNEKTPALSELREQDSVSDLEFMGARLSYVNESGSPYGVVRVKHQLPTADADELEQVDQRFKVVEVSVKGEVAETKKAISEMVRTALDHDIRLEEVGSVEEQPAPGKKKQEFPTYRMVVLYDSENGRHDTQ